MADYAQKYSDKQAEEFAQQIEKVYSQAAREIKEKLNAFMAKHKAKSEKLMRDVQNGVITEHDYQAWLRGQVFQGKQWEQKLKDITDVYVNADSKSREILGGTTKNVFMEAANYTAYDIEKNVGGAIAFNIYDEKTVERLIKDDPKMLPEWKIDEPKDYSWNEKRVQNAVAQGIIQGESVHDIGRRLTVDLSAQNANKMDMFARTAVTGAHNAGRIERLHEAKDMGINVRKRWMATLDNRTRDSHAELDGETIDVDKKFSNGLMYPGDPSGNPSEVYNCRCTMIYVYPEYEQHFERTAYYEEGDPEYDPKHRNYEIVKNMTYREWKALKKSTLPSDVENNTPNIVAGVDIDTPQYNAFSPDFVRKIPEWSDEIQKSELPSRKEQFEYYKLAQTETDKELMEFMADLESNVLTYRNESETSQREHAEIFSVLARPHEGKLYRGESGEWVKTYGEFTEGKVITFSHLSFTSPNTKTPFAHTGVIWEFESGTKSINFVGQDNVDDDELILGNFVIVKKTSRNGVPVVTLRPRRS